MHPQFYVEFDDYIRKYLLYLLLLFNIVCLKKRYRTRLLNRFINMWCNNDVLMTKIHYIFINIIIYNESKKLKLIHLY